MTTNEPLIQPTAVRKNGQLYWKLTDDQSVTLHPDGRVHVRSWITG
jgi:hypothetical protein